MNFIKKLLLLTLSFCFQNLAIAYELGIVAMFRDEAPYLKEWIEYHKMVGVDHFWLYCDARNEDDYQSILEPYIEEGLVEVTENWTVPEKLYTINSIQQCKANLEVLKKNKNNVKWLAFIDIDEFIVPMEETSILECLNTHFSDAAAIYVNWLNFGTSNTLIPKGDPILFQLSSCSFKTHPRNGIGKTILRVECSSIEEFSSPHFCPLKPDFHYVTGSGQPIKWNNKKPREPNLDVKHHEKYLRINHYALRDEDFFLKRRLEPAKLKQGAYTENLLIEHYHSFSQTKDFTIMNLIRNHHPKMYEEFWKNKQTQNSPD